MPREFELRKEVTLDATPEQVWEAIATGQGIDAWFMGRNQVEPREGGRTSMTIGGHTEEGVVTAWEPPRRFAYRGDSPGGTGFMAFEWLVQGATTAPACCGWCRAASSATTGRPSTTPSARAGTCTSTSSPSTSRTSAAAPPCRSWPCCPGRATPTTSGRPSRPGWARAARPPRGTRSGAPRGAGPLEGVVDYVSPEALGVRADDGLYRFIRGYDGTVAVGHHLFSGHVEPDEAERAWQAWLGRLFRVGEAAHRRGAAR